MQAGECGGQVDEAMKERIRLLVYSTMALFNHMTLATIVAHPPHVRLHESLFIDAKLNGKDVYIMVDTGATHNFVTEEQVKDLRLVFMYIDTLLKTVNTLPSTVHGFAPRVQLALGEWKGWMDFTIVPMDVHCIGAGILV